MKLFFSFIACFVLGFSAPPPNDIINWTSGQKLTWNDFKGKGHSFAGGMDAYTAYVLAFSPTNAGDSLLIKVTSGFDRNKSSVKPDKKTDSLLVHEQGHFDIAEIYARKLRKKLSGTKFNMKNAQAVLTAQYKAACTELDADQGLYDKETDHSRMTANQEKWNKKIKEQLKELAKFENTTVRTTFTK